MNKKIIVLIVLVAVIAVGYASYYAYASMTLLPGDLEVFKDELEATSSPGIPESVITEMENSASMVESYNALSMVSQNERNSVAEQMSDNVNYTKMMKELKNNFTINHDIALRYDILLKGDVAQEIRLTYTNETLSLIDQIKNNTDKQAADIKNGDSASYANDVREFAKLARQFNTNEEQAHTHLQNVVNKLGG
jgi:uncharacterized protein YaiI (UPF0178 family)